MIFSTLTLLGLAAANVHKLKLQKGFADGDSVQTSLSASMRHLRAEFSSQVNNLKQKALSMEHKLSASEFNYLKDTHDVPLTNFLNAQCKFI